MGRRRHSHDLRVRVAGQAFVNKMMVQGGWRSTDWGGKWCDALPQKKWHQFFIPINLKMMKIVCYPFITNLPSDLTPECMLYCEYRSVFACAIPLWWERQNDKSNTTQEQRRIMQITNRAHLERCHMFRFFTHSKQLKLCLALPSHCEISDERTVSSHCSVKWLTQ